MPSAYTSSSSSSACTQSTGVRSVVSDANGKLSVPSLNPSSACHIADDECSRDAIQCGSEIENLRFTFET